MAGAVSARAVIGQVLGLVLATLLIVALLVILIGSILVACWVGVPAPGRTFKTEELLLTLSELPPGRDWQTSGIYDSPVLEICTGDCWEVDFSAQVPGTTTPRRVMGQQVWGGLSIDRNQRTYERWVRVYNAGFKTPSAWTYQSPWADKSGFGCGDVTHGAAVGELCRWQATYDEYFVLLFAIYPDVSLGEIERTVRAIDLRVSGKLGKK